MSSSETSGEDRKDYFEEFECSECKKLAYRRPGNVRQQCNECRIKGMRQMRKKRKEILKKMEAEEEEIRRLSKHMIKYNQEVSFRKLSSDSDTSFSESDDETADPLFKCPEVPSPETCKTSSKEKEKGMREEKEKAWVNEGSSDLFSRRNHAVLRLLQRS